MTTPPGPPPPYGPGPYDNQPHYPPPQGAYPPPPPLPYSGEPGGFYPPPRKSRKTLYIVLGVVAALVLVLGGGATLLFLLGKDTVTATDVAVGDCLREIPGARVVTVQTTACEEPHAGEVFAVLLMPDGGFPGQPAIEAYAERCAPALSAYSPEAALDAAVNMYVLYPTAETWADGDRAVTCIATFEPPRTGSMRG
ncbi:septum formation family protein [Mycolicibacterium flavescens]|uniref:Septum formation family protein n=1 Tax=Mycolicibacterium flavescens TaxID=1776 RepID=A0A1E3RFN6_MYCFV|nr:septum formation family protein [Mycolicibacterium flavescens]MCV7282781.1 septum formation family protein [Mycolicibacterium flavescens]ODQ88696.1 septum formation family protein [Mycolicibacterium flavescens]